jgi:hypothetical protein
MDDVRRIADAVLYEGYILWPYRRSALKNQRRWTFGGVYPEAHAARHPDDPSVMQTQCLVLSDRVPDVRVRFLHVVTLAEWEEAIELEVGPGPIDIPAGAEDERTWRALRGAVDVALERMRPGLSRVTVRISNATPLPADADRQRALEQTFCSTHTVLAGAPFVSLTDPPEELRVEAERCQNLGTWPVLVGDGSTMLSSPIILPDHPQVAPESPGDLFDGGEIDQLLTLGILSMTEEEKAEMRGWDPRAREILERTEALSRDELMRLHGRWS